MNATLQLHPHAMAAIRAARNPQWGRYAISRYLDKRGVPPGLYVLARVLECADRAGVRVGG